MYSKMDRIPMDLFNKLITYGIYEPPHYIAYKTAIKKPIFSCELNSFITGDMKLREGYIDELEELNMEWLYYLIMNSE